MIRAYTRLIAIALWLAVCLPPGWVCYRLKKEQALRTITMWFYHGVCHIIGLRVVVEGALDTRRPLLLVSNHISYMDIIALGSVFPVLFTPKSEIAGWPLIGFLSRVIGVVFIDRRVSQTAANLSALREALAEGKTVSLFAEGTTSDGKRMLPFRSAYFRLAEEPIHGRALLIQPTTLIYTHINGLPLDTAQTPLVAWYGDMELASHALKLLIQRTVTVKIILHEAFAVEPQTSRKAISEQCHKTIETAFMQQRQQEIASR